MADKFVKYRSFNDKALATALCEQLSVQQIPFEWESTEGFFDVSFANNDILNLYYVKLRRQDFERADKLLADSASADEQPLSDYYLFSFSTEELKDVLKTPDEWNAFDQYWARKILASRGIEVNEEEVQAVKEVRLAELQKPWELGTFWILIAFTALLIGFVTAHFYAALAVLFTGLYISFSKKTMPNGQRVPAFSAMDRVFGKIAIIAGGCLTVFILLQYYGYIPFMFPL